MFKQSLNGCLLIASCVFVIDSGASSLILESEINASTAYDDNVTYSAAGADESSSIVTITPKLKLTHQNDHWETTANARVSGTTYSAQLQNQFAKTCYKNRPEWPVDRASPSNLTICRNPYEYASFQ